MCACMSTRSTPMSQHTYLMSLNKYTCHIENWTTTVIMLYGHINPVFLHILTKHNQLQHLLHMLLLCMGQQQICHIYKLVLWHILHSYVHIRTSHELTAINNVTTKIYQIYVLNCWSSIRFKANRIVFHLQDKLSLDYLPNFFSIP